MPILFDPDNDDLTQVRSDLLSEIEQAQEREADLRQRMDAGEAGLDRALRIVQARIQLWSSHMDAAATFQAATEH